MSASQTQTVLFFIRHYNDLDHVTPVIWKLAELHPGVKSEVFLLSDKLRNDFRKRFLSNQPGVSVFDTTDIEGITGKPFLKSAETARLLISSYFSTREYRVICFDWLMDTTEDITTSHIGFALEIIGYFRDKHSVPSISLPHGDSPHSNLLIFNNDFSKQDADIYTPGRLFDRLVVPNSLCAQRYNNHLPLSCIKVLGSARYNREWLNQLGLLTNGMTSFSKKASFKILVLPRPTVFPIFWEELFRVIHMLGRESAFEIGIQGHTRQTKTELTKAAQVAGYPFRENVTVFNHDVHSSSLVAAADLVLDMATSASYDAILMEKPVLAMDYLHAGKSVLGDYFPESAVNYRDQLLQKIDQIWNHKKNLRSYSETKDFCKEILGIGKEERSPLELYCDCILNATRYGGRKKAYEINRPPIQKAPPGIFKLLSETEKVNRLERTISELTRQNMELQNQNLIYRLRSTLKEEPLVFLYGAGKHTDKLLSLLDRSEITRLAGIVDDLNAGKEIYGVTVKSLKNVQNGCFILSTDTFQKTMTERIKSVFPDAKVIDLYHLPQ